MFVIRPNASKHRTYALCPFVVTSPAIEGTLALNDDIGNAMKGFSVLGVETGTDRLSSSDGPNKPGQRASGPFSHGEDEIASRSRDFIFDYSSHSVLGRSGFGFARGEGCGLAPWAVLNGRDSGDVVRWIFASLQSSDEKAFALWTCGSPH